MMRIPSRHLAAVLLAMLLLAGCKSSNAGGATGGSGVGNKTSLLIGFSVSMTGPNADTGKLTRDAYQFWADTVNAKGGLKVGGKSLKIQLKYYDDESNANTTATNVQPGPYLPDCAAISQHVVA